jgi:hypothetical protein
LRTLFLKKMYKLSQICYQNLLKAVQKPLLLLFYILSLFFTLFTQKNASVIQNIQILTAKRKSLVFPLLKKLVIKRFGHESESSLLLGMHHHSLHSFFETAGSEQKRMSKSAPLEK